MRRITQIIVIAVTALAIAWDITAVVTGGAHSTISQVVLGWALLHPIIPFAWGALQGHLFWPAKYGAIRRWISLGALVSVTIALLLLDIFGILPGITPVLPLAIGLVAGHYGWSQNIDKLKGK